MIKLPERFKRKLEQNSEHLEIEIISIKRNFTQIYTDNNTYFFNEYTDHGFRHINNVLKAIDDLIPEETWRLLSERDVFIIMMSVFLHDLGMHIQPITFKALIDGEYNEMKEYGFLDKKWMELWKDYLEEAKRFSEQELNEIFGDATYEIEIPDFESLEKFNENHKKLIGEFIRRHHPRIAFEVAFIGLKSHKGGFIDLCPNLSEDFRFIAGIVARSHGMYVRETFPILKRKFSDIWKMPNGIHSIYLMILLRLGDYLQIDESRVFKVPFETKLFKSPISLFEHEKHFSISAYQPLSDDPETLFFNANPLNSRMYVSLKNLFNAIQTEFDTSWAIIGDVYGSIKGKKKPLIQYRRVKSKLEDEAFTKSLPFVPETITFSADKELLKLLIAPLYGYKPTYGIRELLQNSIDACWEREYIESKCDNKYLGEINIIFTLNDEKRTIFSISDNGKGMELIEIQKYFLRAGSSLKKSREWKKNFIKANKIPAIHRIGKFGIGVLAAYLLGNEIIVETRHYNSSIGYYFRTSIDNPNIEIFKRENLEVGTKITIYVADKIRNELLKSIHDRLKANHPEHYFRSPSKWDKWFTLNNPKVNIQVYNFPAFQPYTCANPNPNDKLPSDWKKFSTNEFDNILWTFSENYAKVDLTCNGIVIPNTYNLKRETASDLSLKKPYISIFDSKGNLKVELNRNSLVNNELQFEDELFHNIFKDIISSILTQEFIFEKGIFLLKEHTNTRFKYPGLGNDFEFFFSKDGYGINMPFFRNVIKNKRILQLTINPEQIAVYDSLKIKLTSQLISILPSPHIVRLKTEIEKQTSENDYSIANKYVTENIFKENPNKSIKIDYVFLPVENIRTINSKELKFIELCEKLLRNNAIIPFSIVQRRQKFRDVYEQLNIQL